MAQVFGLEIFHPTHRTLHSIFLIDSIFFVTILLAVKIYLYKIFCFPFLYEFSMGKKGSTKSSASPKKKSSSSTMKKSQRSSGKTESSPNRGREASSSSRIVANSKSPKAKRTSSKKSGSGKSVPKDKSPPGRDDKSPEKNQEVTTSSSKNPRSSKATSNDSDVQIVEPKVATPDPEPAASQEGPIRGRPRTQRRERSPTPRPDYRETSSEHEESKRRSPSKDQEKRDPPTQSGIIDLSQNSDSPIIKLIPRDQTTRGRSFHSQVNGYRPRQYSPIAGEPYYRDGTEYMNHQRDFDYRHQRFPSEDPQQMYFNSWDSNYDYNRSHPYHNRPGSSHLQPPGLQPRVYDSIYDAYNPPQSYRTTAPKSKAQLTPRAALDTSRICEIEKDLLDDLRKQDTPTEILAILPKHGIKTRSHFVSNLTRLYIREMVERAIPDPEESGPVGSRLCGLHKNLEDATSELDKHNQREAAKEQKEGGIAADRLERMRQNLFAATGRWPLDHFQPSPIWINRIDKGWKDGRYPMMQISSCRTLNGVIKARGEEMNGTICQEPAEERKKYATKDSSFFFGQLKTILNTYLFMSYEHWTEEDVNFVPRFTPKMADQYLDCLLRYNLWGEPPSVASLNIVIDIDYTFRASWAQRDFYNHENKKMTLDEIIKDYLHKEAIHKIDFQRRAKALAEGGQYYGQPSWYENNQVPPFKATPKAQPKQKDWTPPAPAGRKSNNSNNSRASTRKRTKNHHPNGTPTFSGNNNNKKNDYYDNQGRNDQKWSTETCKNFASGKCNFGQNCKYVHDRSNNKQW